MWMVEAWSKSDKYATGKRKTGRDKAFLLILSASSPTPNISRFEHRMLLLVYDFFSFLLCYAILSMELLVKLIMNKLEKCAVGKFTVLKEQDESGTQNKWCMFIFYGAGINTINVFIQWSEFRPFCGRSIYVCMRLKHFNGLTFQSWSCLYGPLSFHNRISLLPIYFRVKLFTVEHEL